VKLAVCMQEGKGDYGRPTANRCMADFQHRRYVYFYTFTCKSGDDRSLARQACRLYRRGREPRDIDYSWEFLSDTLGGECGHRALEVTCETD